MAKKIRLTGPVLGGARTWLYDFFKMSYISADLVARELESANGEDVEIYVNSPGGLVDVGSEIYTVLKEYSGKKTVKVTGYAASAASVFIMAADEILMSPTAQIMIHNAKTWTEGDRNVHQSNANMLSSVDLSITNAYRLRTGKSAEELLALMNKTTWMNAQQAVEAGFADGILFDEENVLVNSSDDIPSMLSPEVESKIMNILISSALKGGKVEGLNISEIAQHVEQPQVLNNLNNHTSEVDVQMDLEKLKAEHPDLYNQVYDLGVKEGEEKGAKNERERIKSIDGIANTVSTDLVAKAKYETPITAEALALQALKADAAKGTKHIEDRQKELETNGDVSAGKSPEEVKAAEEAEQIDLIAAAANSGRTEAK